MDSVQVVADALVGTILTEVQKRLTPLGGRDLCKSRGDLGYASMTPSLARWIMGFCV
jgi:hypothetical protein